MSKIEVNAVEPQCGTTLTLGASGDTVTLGSGASQSGFGRTGTVDWQTSIKTSGFTAVSGEGYFCNTTGGAFTVTLPASPSVGDIVAVKDYASTFNTNFLTIGRNSSNIEGLASDKILNTQSLSITFVYADATKGWLAVNDMTTEQVPSFIAATGGTETTSGDFKIHTFTGPGTFTVTCAGNAAGSDKVSYMVVAGGGGGGANRAGGGGAGGFREGKDSTTDTYSASPLATTGLPVSVQAYPITVGGGGAGRNWPTATLGISGSNSSFSSITSAGGGGGASRSSTCGGANGGSGGGSGPNGTNPTTLPGGSGNTPPVSPPQGNPGGGNYPKTPGDYTPGSGGGGATAAGANGPACVGTVAGAGGAGATTSINGTPTAYAGGGGGGSDNPAPTGGAGGTGGGGTGGAGTPGSPVDATDGTANTGGGAGGGGAPAGDGGAGGSGIVIIRYKFQ